jgi:sugar phosphate isomerase/epimerase
MSTYRRKDFLKLSAGLLGGLTLGSMACNNDSTATAGKKDTAGADSGGAKTAGGVALGAFGIQLYSLRDVIVKDPKAILKQVADMGYTQVEGYETDKGILWGMNPDEFKSYMSSIGLSMVATHYDSGAKDFEKRADQAAQVGMKSLFYPYEGTGKSIDDYKKLADTFNKNGEICKKYGVGYGFHNHAMSFKAINGEFPQDVLMKNTDASLVDYELDIYWVVAAGEDPEAWLKKYPNRFKSCHVKDRSRTPGSDDGENSVDLGTGSIDFSKVLRTAADNGMKYYIVEQEAYPNGSSLDAAKVDATYMKNLKI